jgi:hypothetical protein
LVEKKRYGVRFLTWYSHKKRRKKMKKKAFILTILFSLIPLLGFGIPALAEAPIKPGGPFIPYQGSADSWEDANRTTNMTFQELEEELFKLESRSKGIMTLDTAGYSIEGRPLYIAKIGEGPTRMWIQGRIHGREPLGNDICLEIIKSLLSKDKSILDEMTFWIIPGYNPDGSEIYSYGNAAGVDLNLDWYRPSGGYTQIESKAFWYAWEDFKPHYAIDVHGTWAHFVADDEGNDTNLMAAFFIGCPMQPEDLEPWVWDTNRRMGVIVYDATEKLGWCNPAEYIIPFSVPSGVISSMMAGLPGPEGEDPDWKTPAIFIEIRNRNGNKSRGYLIKEGVVALHAVIDSIVSGELGNVVPGRWDDIPAWGSRIGSDDKWPQW